MNTVVTHPAVAMAARVAETIDGIFATIDGWRDHLEAVLGDGLELTATALDPVVEQFAVPAVTNDTLLTGAGFVAAPGILADARWHLAWWLRDAAAPRRLATIDDPGHEQFRDYTALEWWRVPARTSARHLTGPYVDYVCTDDYAVTITTPVRLGGEMVGLVGIDALVDRLEHELLPVLRAGGDDTTLVNASGRVVTSTDASREPGSILRLEGLADAVASGRAAASVVTLPGGAAVLTCGDTSLTLVLQ
ncbi:cache domain-containing protein [Microbacterium sp. SS28]|uniref:cache domain-containing protein n=1 Tax=Microbacterium sp. SS28 TaxID=2919948 RepID=UPI001FAB2E8D|nr:cache domain-containing protein [Microbacterium sp. SS28]